MPRCSLSLLALPLLLGACAGDDGGLTSAGRYLMHTVVLGVEGDTSYVNPLQSIEPQTIDLRRALEKQGWSDLWVHGGKAFVSDGESPIVTRYAVDAQGALVEDGSISFQNYGVGTAGLTRQLVIDDTKAYMVNAGERTVVVWNPTTMTITGTFALPELPDRGVLQLAGPSADRASAIRGDRAYLAFYWAEWDDYTIADDSVVLVVDTETDAIVETIPVPCPEINFASVDEEEGVVYFSNWGFSAASTFVHGTRDACAVRIRDGAEALDPSWSLTFSDVTEGREACSLRYVGEGKALITVLHDERIGADPTVTAIADGDDWQLWTLDLATRQAAPLGALGFHAFGLYGANVEGETLLFLPSADWATTTAYHLGSDGSAELLWRSPGWQTRLFAL